MARPRMYLVVDGKKECSKCHHAKPLEEFGKSAKASDGHQAECKDCHKKRYDEAPRYPRDRTIKNLTCARCGKLQDASEFYDDPVVPSGIKAACRTCVMDANGQWAQENPEARKVILNRSAQKAREDDEKRPILYARTRQWQIDHPEQVRIHNLTDMANNGQKPERVAARAHAHQRWFGAHPGYKGAASHKRRALLREVTILDAMINVWILYDRDHGICTLCRFPVDKTLQWPDKRIATIDHAIPVTRGGAHAYSNTKLAHHYCNTLKNNRLETTELLASIRTKFAAKFGMPITP
jgi:5-methylcytosine-specific restriction endonuclease McrA